MFEVSPATSRHRVGEARLSAATERHAFNFDPTRNINFRMIRETKVEARTFFDGDFAFDRFVPHKGLEGIRFEYSPGHVIRLGRVKPDPDAPDPNHFEGMTELSLFAVMCGTANGRPRRFRSGHAARIWAMHCYFRAVLERDVGQKAFVA